MSTVQNEQAVLGKRKNILKDDPDTGLKVTASLRDQQLEKLAVKLEKMNFAEKVVQMWDSENANRSKWLERQDEYLREIDEFLEPIYEPHADWNSVLHLPTTLTVCKTYHARMFSALWGIDPPFTCKARKGANEDRALLVEELMRYTLRDWANEYDGVESELDGWIWDWVTKGNGILKSRWEKKYTRFVDVDTEQINDIELMYDEETGESVPTPVVKEVEREVTRTEEVCNGPVLERIPLEDVVMIGESSDPQKCDAVIQQAWSTASQLWSLVDQGIFRKDAVEEVIKGGRNYTTDTPDQSGNIKQRQKEQGGESILHQEHTLDRYRIMEAYVKVDVDGSGINSDVIVWVHAQSRQILRATYLRRVMPTGKLPFHVIEFHRRHGTKYAVGLVELVYSLSKEIDAIHNMNIDVGILSSTPFGFYRPTASSLKEEALPIEPGAMIPVDNPSTDVYFPNMGVKTTFGFQEQQALQQQIERLTSVSDLNLGIISGQGAARTATGTRAILGESSNNLDIFIKRMHRGWKRALRYQFEMLQQRIPDGFMFRITGDDGNDYWRQVQSKKELEGMFDFELDANSANSNKQITVEQANMIYQLTANPIDLQFGIVTPSNRYEALVNMLKVNGIKSVGKYTTKPMNYAVQYSPIEVLDRVLSGMDVPINPTMDLQGILSLIEEFLTNEELNGQFGPSHIAVLQYKAQEIQALMAALQSAQANQSVMDQAQMNTQATAQPGNMQQVAVNQQPAPGEGG